MQDNPVLIPAAGATPSAAADAPKILPLTAIQVQHTFDYQKITNTVLVILAAVLGMKLIVLVATFLMRGK